MALDTPLNYRNLVIYEVYVRNHGPNGTFAEVEADLPRIASMGVDIIWFMPIHPIGVLNKKGSLGCPYSIRNYRGVNPEYGTQQDFEHLVEAAHHLGMKVMIDVVYNHTAHDALLVQEHPEYYHQDEHGNPITTVPEWSDVIDLKHPNPALAEYLIDALKGWARVGVTGFRCDVASLLPLDFWQRARQAVAEVHPRVVWLAESVHAGWVAYRRKMGYPTLSDAELYAAFDLTYDYDIWPLFVKAVDGELPVGRYLDVLRLQDAIYPQNYVKMRCVENHDQPRIMQRAPSRAQALAWTAFQAFNKGALLLYAGQESEAVQTPSLFDKQPIAWGDYSLQPFLSKLARLKKDPALVGGKFTILHDDPAVQAVWEFPGSNLYGVFNVSGATGRVKVQAPDGTHMDYLTNAARTVENGEMDLPQDAVILRIGKDAEYKQLSSDILD